MAEVDVLLENATLVAAVEVRVQAVVDVQLDDVTPSLTATVRRHRGPLSDENAERRTVKWVLDWWRK